MRTMGEGEEGVREEASGQRPLSKGQVETKW